MCLALYSSLEHEYKVFRFFFFLALQTADIWTTMHYHDRYHVWSRVLTHSTVCPITLAAWRTTALSLIVTKTSAVTTSTLCIHSYYHCILRQQLRVTMNKTPWELTLLCVVSCFFAASLHVIIIIIYFSFPEKPKVPPCIIFMVALFTYKYGSYKVEIYVTIKTSSTATQLSTWASYQTLPGYKRQISQDISLKMFPF